MNWRNGVCQIPPCPLITSGAAPTIQNGLACIVPGGSSANGLSAVGPVNLWVRKAGTKPNAWVTHHFSKSPIVDSSIAWRPLPSGNTLPTGWSFSACAQMKTGICFVVRLEGRAGHKIVNRDVSRAFDGRIHQEHKVCEFRRHHPNRRGRRLNQRLRESGKDDHAAEAVADDHQERVSSALLLAVAIVAQPPEQFPHGTHRHALPSRLPGLEGCVSDDVA
jgi:hypothetical protein